MSSNRLRVEETTPLLNTRRVTKALSDGGWHRIEELEAETELYRETLLRVVNFLRDYGFAEISVGGEAAKLDKDYLNI